MSEFESWREGYQAFIPDSLDYDMIEIYCGGSFYVSMDLVNFVMDNTVFTVDCLILYLLDTK